MVVIASNFYSVQEIIIHYWVPSSTNMDKLMLIVSQAWMDACYFQIATHPSVILHLARYRTNTKPSTSKFEREFEILRSVDNSKGLAHAHLSTIRGVLRQCKLDRPIFFTSCATKNNTHQSINLPPSIIHSKFHCSSLAKKKPTVTKAPNITFLKTMSVTQQSIGTYTKQCFKLTHKEQCELGDLLTSVIISNWSISNMENFLYSEANPCYKWSRNALPVLDTIHIMLKFKGLVQTEKICYLLRKTVQILQKQFTKSHVLPWISLNAKIIQSHAKKKQ